MLDSLSLTVMILVSAGKGTEGAVQGHDLVKGPSFGNQYWLVEKVTGDLKLFDNQYTLINLKTGDYLDLNNG